MACIYLVRHGEVEGNQRAQPAYVGWSDLPLTARGEAQSRAVAQRLARAPLHAVYASDLQRARRTAEAIASLHGLKVRCDAQWREVNYGAWEGLGAEEIASRWPDVWQSRMRAPFEVAAPDGESLQAAWARWHGAWQQLLARHQNENVALVGHNGVLRVLLCHALGAPLENYRRIHIANCSVSCLEIENAGKPPRIAINYINETCHLNGI